MPRGSDEFSTILATTTGEGIHCADGETEACRHWGNSPLATELPGGGGEVEPALPCLRCCPCRVRPHVRSPPGSHAPVRGPGLLHGVRLRPWGSRHRAWLVPAFPGPVDLAGQLAGEDGKLSPWEAGGGKPISSDPGAQSSLCFLPSGVGGGWQPDDITGESPFSGAVFCAEGGAYGL